MKGVSVPLLLAVALLATAVSRASADECLAGCNSSEPIDPCNVPDNTCTRCTLLNVITPPFGMCLVRVLTPLNSPVLLLTASPSALRIR